MNWRVVVLPEFYSDLEEAGEWYEQKLQGLGTRFAGEVLDVWADLAVNPLLGCKKHPRRNIRWRYPAKFPYKIVYSVEEKTKNCCGHCLDSCGKACTGARKADARLMKRILAIHYNRRKVYIRHILTHSDYDKETWKS